MIDLERKTFRFDVKQMDEEGVFEGYAAVFGNVDLQGDVIDPGAFTKTLKENSKFPLLWQHQPDQVIGVTLEAREDDKGLWIKGQLNLLVAKAKEVYALLKQGAIRGMSIGYDTIKDAWDGKVRHLKEIKLWEPSIVTFPANPLAGVEAVKNLADTNLSVTGFDLALYAVVGAAHVGGAKATVNRALAEQAVKSLQALLATTEPPDGTQSRQQPPSGGTQEPDTDHSELLVKGTLEELRKLRVAIGGGQS